MKKWKRRYLDLVGQIVELTDALELSYQHPVKGPLREGSWAAENDPMTVATNEDALDLEQQLHGIVNHHGTWNTSITCTAKEIQALLHKAIGR